MANRPWVTPQEVRDYSEIASVQKRSDTRLAVDIARAEQYVITYTHNTFESYKEIPQPVKTAVLILAEAYGHNAALVAKDVKSETFDDYSYTSETSQISIDGLDLAALLDDFVIAEPRNGITLRMRRL
nr:MAG TPA: Head Tail Connector Protein [Caudoviricetes sp.]